MYFVVCHNDIVIYVSRSLALALRCGLEFLEKNDANISKLEENRNDSWIELSAPIDDYSSWIRVKINDLSAIRYSGML